MNIPTMITIAPTTPPIIGPRDNEDLSEAASVEFGPAMVVVGAAVVNPVLVDPAATVVSDGRDVVSFGREVDAPGDAITERVASLAPKIPGIVVPLGFSAAGDVLRVARAFCCVRIESITFLQKK